MSNEVLLEVNTIINNITVNIFTIYQRGEKQRKLLREFLIPLGLELDKLNKDIFRIIKNIQFMTKKECLEELAK